ncbi:hypothetical protein GCM10029992_07990 [Glycomyces albus]
MIVGVPGVGKTALAMYWSHRTRDRFPDGVLYADLHGWGPTRPVTAEELLPGWLWSLGSDTAAIPDDITARIGALRTALANRRMLMVLDNVSDEEQVRMLMPGNAGCSVLVTSRKAMPGLAIHYGAESLRLDSLSPVGAAALLRITIGDRVHQSERSTAKLAELCGRLPLALRVAAEIARADSGDTLDSLVATLKDETERLDQLDTQTERSNPRAVFSWSYQRLSTSAAALFRHVALLPGSTFDRYAMAAAIDAPAAEAGRQLRELEHSHLLTRTGRGRYQMHDLLRLYASELLSPMSLLLTW